MPWILVVYYCAVDIRAYSAPPGLLAEFKGGTTSEEGRMGSKGNERERERESREREGREGKRKKGEGEER